MKKETSHLDWMSCRRCGARFLASDPRVELCIPCWLDVENGEEMPRLRRENGKNRLDPHDLFKIIQAEAAVGMRRADFREQVQNIYRAAWVLSERIEEFRRLQRAM